MEVQAEGNWAKPNNAMPQVTEATNEQRLGYFLGFPPKARTAGAFSSVDEEEQDSTGTAGGGNPELRDGGPGELLLVWTGSMDFADAVRRHSRGCPFSPTGDWVE